MHFLKKRFLFFLLGFFKGLFPPSQAQSLEEKFWMSPDPWTDVDVQRLCEEIKKVYERNKWGEMPVRCSELDWEVMGYSVEKRPLLLWSFGDSQEPVENIVQCGIHGDELPSVAMCFYLIREIFTGSRLPRKKTRLVIQPLLNPDGFLRNPPTRPNARGVDINRNFPTQDWFSEALSSWSRRDKKDDRKFPGSEPGSEPETQAVVNYLKKNRPQKIISIHAPLGFLDLDTSGEKELERRAKFLAVNMSKNAGNYRFVRFGFYPGSLGNYAGRERQIPVYTLELPEGVTKPTVDEYWKRFRVAIWRALDFNLETGQFIED